MVLNFYFNLVSDIKNRFHASKFRPFVKKLDYITKIYSAYDLLMLMKNH